MTDVQKKEIKDVIHCRSMTRGRNVSAMAWNKSDADLIAVGYGQFEYSRQKGGLVCCWSLKNPEVISNTITM